MGVINRTAEALASICAKKGVYHRDKIEEYAYGYELLISTILNLSMVLTIGALLCEALEAFVFTAGFAFLRTIAGGYHAKTHRACISIFSSVFLFFAITIKILPTGYVLPYIIVISLISSVIIYIEAPVAAPNKPLSMEKQKRLKRLCYINILANLVICVMIIIFPSLGNSFFTAYFSGILAASVSLLAAKLYKNKAKEVNVNA